MMQALKGRRRKAGSVLALSGEFARWQGISGRMVADALHLARNAQLAVRALRT
jgi:hypothetical protein